MRTKYGSFEWLVLVFRLCNALATFSTLMNAMFHDCLDVFVVLYLDDILIYSHTLAEHEHHVRNVLERLSHNKLYLKLLKCEFLVTTLYYLGYKVLDGQLKLDESTEKAIKDWPTPHHVHDVGQFNGLAQIYMSSLEMYSDIVARLTTLSKKDAKWKWIEKHERVFQKMKDLVSSELVLVLLDFELY